MLFQDNTTPILYSQAKPRDKPTPSPELRGGGERTQGPRALGLQEKSAGLKGRIPKTGGSRYQWS